ncbi:MAG: glycosyltransferase, partial [Chromatiales bacterium]|nr:glycosyltransferase [Chromatiales bacterium]
RQARTQVEFSAGHRELSLHRVEGKITCPGVRHFVVDGHALSSGRIYEHDSPDRPFATDAGKFALFCAGVTQFAAEGHFGHLDIVHLHDWHAALVALLLRASSRYAKLASVQIVFTVHNLALQGIRPLGADPSSLNTWFPGLRYRQAWVVDPRWLDCANAMAIGIRLADAVHAVSPAYAQEILQPTSATHMSGGEGLEEDLRQAKSEGRLFGILNGMTYPEETADLSAPRVEWSATVKDMQRELLKWAAQTETLRSAHFIASERLREYPSKRPPLLLTSVGRLTEQKVSLLAVRQADGRTTLDHLLDRLAVDDRYVVLGAGEPYLEAMFCATAAKDERLLFLNGYSDGLADALYESGDLFLMPSSFEPCGISQLLAMRAGQPCLVHGVGGLKDTVVDGVNGFSFKAGVPDPHIALLNTVDAALRMFREEPGRWATLVEHARSTRFVWRASAEAYMRQLYRVDLPNQSQSRDHLGSA